MSGPIAQEAVASTRVVVNLFDGGPKSTVTMAIGNGSAAIAMKRVLRRDPFVDEVYSRNMETKKPWVKSGLSTHLWQAPLPADLPPGAHRVAVAAVDEYGRKHADSMILEVTGS